MQSLCARRRVESGGRGDEGFGFRLAVDDRRVVVRGDYGWVRAKFEHDDAQEGCDDVEQELVCVELGEHDDASRGISFNYAPCDFEAGGFQDEGAAEASRGGSDGGEPQTACGVCGERAVAADGSAVGNDTQRGCV